MKYGSYQFTIRSKSGESGKWEIPEDFAGVQAVILNG
jgi:hypothetical protein